MADWRASAGRLGTHRPGPSPRSHAGPVLAASQALCILAQTSRAGGSFSWTPPAAANKAALCIVCWINKPDSEVQPPSPRVRPHTTHPTSPACSAPSSSTAPLAQGGLETAMAVGFWEVGTSPLCTRRTGRPPSPFCLMSDVTRSRKKPSFVRPSQAHGFGTAYEGSLCRPRGCRRDRDVVPVCLAGERDPAG